MKACKLVLTVAFTLAIAIALVLAIDAIGSYRAAQLPKKTIRVTKEMPLVQIADLYEESGAGDIQFITEDVYGQAILDMNNASVEDISSMETIVVPWNK